MKKKNLYIVLLIVLAAAAIVLAGFLMKQNALKKINSFDDCVKAGYPVLETYPGQCNLPDGRTFIQQINQ